MKRAIVATAVAVSALCAPLRAAEQVTVTVTDEVVRQDTPRIGLNICKDPVENRSTLLENCLNPGPGMEAHVLNRQIVVAAGGDARTIVLPKPDAWDWQPLPDSFWQDAEYEVVFGQAAGRKGTISAADGLALTLAHEGPAIAAGDVIRIEGGRGMYLTHFTRGNPNEAAILAPADGAHAPWHGGETCIRIEGKDRKSGATVKLRSFPVWGRPRQGGRSGGSEERYVHEKSYRLTIWAKGTPGGIGSIRFENTHSHAGHEMPDDFKLTDQWAKYELVRPGRSMLFTIFNLSNGEEAYIDNFTISEDNGGEPMAILPRVIDALVELQPGTVRLSGGTRGESLDNWLAHPFERKRLVDSGVIRDPYSPNLPDGLMLCERSGADPWLVMGLAMTGGEWDGLLEYLAGAADSPYGTRRKQAGRSEPWLGEFGKIYVELAYEPWDTENPWSAENAQRYAALAEHVFGRVRKNKYHSQKIRLVATGNAAQPAWNEAVLAGCKSMDILGLAPVISRERLVDAESEAPLEPGTLMRYPESRFMPLWRTAREAADAAGKGAAVASLETRSDEEAFRGPERSLYRSLAATVAQMDQLLLALSHGSEAVAFSDFAQGADNATHVDAHSMRLQPIGHAIKLFNAHAGGLDLVKSTPGQVLRELVENRVLPLASYAFRKQGGGHVVLLLNRSTETDLSVALDLPGGKAGMRCYRLWHADPLADNLGEESVAPEEFEADADGRIAVPAHSLVLVETGGAR